MTRNKTQFIIAIVSGLFLIAAAIISSPHWFKYFFPDQYIGQNIEENKEEEAVNPEYNRKAKESSENEELTYKSGVTNITIEKLELCPINSELPVYFYAKIVNLGTRSIKDFTVNIDFGRAKFEQIDTNSLGNYSQIDTLNNHVLKIVYKIFAEDDFIDIYCLLSQPSFNSIVLTGANLTFNQKYSYDTYIKYNSNISNKPKFFLGSLLVLLYLVLIVLAIFFLMGVGHFLKKKNLINIEQEE